MKIRLAATLLALVSQTHAQSWSITASAPVQGSATATYTYPSPTTNNATLPVGTVSPGTFLTCSAANSSVALSWTPVVSGMSAPLAFTAHVNCTSYTSLYQQVTTASGHAVIDLTLGAPQPVSGRLWVRVGASTFPSTSSPASSSIALDINADGTVEGIAYVGGAATPFDLPLQIPATGVAIRLVYDGYSGAGGPTIAAITNATLEVLFFPNEPVIAPLATTNTGATMAIDHSLSGTVTLVIGPAPFAPALMAFGGTPINVPLLPTVTVLVSPDFLIANVGSITLPLPPFPPGTAIYAQGLVIDTLGRPRSTNSIRALW